MWVVSKKCMTLQKVTTWAQLKDPQEPCSTLAMSMQDKKLSANLKAIYCIEVQRLLASMRVCVFFKPSFTLWICFQQKENHIFPYYDIRDTENLPLHLQYYGTFSHYPVNTLHKSRFDSTAFSQFLTHLHFFLIFSLGEMLPLFLSLSSKHMKSLGRPSRRGRLPSVLEN